MCFNLFKKNSKSEAPSQWQSPEVRPSVDNIKSSDNAERKSYKFLLTIENNLPNGCREIPEPNVEHLKEAINNIKQGDDCFFTIEASTPINGCTILQAAGFNHQNGIADAEIVREEIKNGKTVLKAYHCDLTEPELLATMQNFIQRSTPDLDGNSDWYFLMEL